MKLYRIRGGNQEALENKEYNICVGISLGNKWFSPENILGLIQWSLKYTKEFVIVCPADDIHAINIEVRNRRSKESSLKLARRMSDELISSVKVEVEKNINQEDRDRIIYARWEHVVDDEYKRKVGYLYEKFESDHDFRSAIVEIVRDYTSNEEKVFSDDDIHKLCTYILEELPEVLARIKVKGYLYDAYVYPFDNALTMFVEELQQGELFPEIRDTIIDTEPKVFLEVR